MVVDWSRRRITDEIFCWRMVDDADAETLETATAGRRTSCRQIAAAIGPLIGGIKGLHDDDPEGPAVMGQVLRWKSLKRATNWGRIPDELPNCSGLEFWRSHSCAKGAAEGVKIGQEACLDLDLLGSCADSIQVTSKVRSPLQSLLFHWDSLPPEWLSSTCPMYIFRVCR